MTNWKKLDRLYRNHDYQRGYSVGTMASLTSIDNLLKEKGYSDEFTIGVLDAAQVILTKWEEELIKKLLEEQDNE